MLYTYHLGSAWTPASAGHLHRKVCVILLGYLGRGWSKSTTTDELVDLALETNYAQGFDLNVDLYLVDEDDVVSPTIKLSNAKRHVSLLFSFFLEKIFIFWY